MFFQPRVQPEAEHDIFTEPFTRFYNLVFRRDPHFCSGIRHPGDVPFDIRCEREPASVEEGMSRYAEAQIFVAVPIFESIFRKIILQEVA